MSPDNENCTMKGSKPPPPVPPRPSKSLVKEALAKTRQAYGIVQGIRGNTKKPDDILKRQTMPLPASDLQPRIPAQMSHKSLPSYLAERFSNNSSSRPIVYQSQNCRNRSENDKPDNQKMTGQSPRVFEDEHKYANVPGQRAKVKEYDGDKSRKSPSEEEDVASNSSSHWDDILNDRNHVNTLIDEMFASVLEVNLGSSISSHTSSSSESIANEGSNKITISQNLANNNADDENLTVIVINEDREDSSRSLSSERKVTFNDRENHEFLIEELQNMQHQQGKVSKRQYLGSLDSVNGDEKIHMSDWYGVNDGKKVRLSSCHITIEDPCEAGDQISKRKQKINNIVQAYRLPPLPKSLSSFQFMEHNGEMERSNLVENKEKVQFSYQDSKAEVSGREQTNLDRQLAILRREMVSLREQDLSLLAKLWFLSESIHDFRQMMQEQDEDKLNVRLSPSPTPSSLDDEEYYVISTSTC